MILVAENLRGPPERKQPNRGKVPEDFPTLEEKLL